MEERVHSNGSRDGSDTTTSSEPVGGEPTASSETRPMSKTWCTEHEMEMWQCFYEHHKNETPFVGLQAIVSSDQIVLPCRHLSDRPTKNVSVVACPCGRAWKLTLEASGRAWDAQEVGR